MAFNSASDNLVGGFDNNNGASSDMYLYDRVTAAVSLVSHIPGSPSAGGNGGSSAPSLSGDGRSSASGSSASDLVSGQSGTRVAARTCSVTTGRAT